MQMKRIISLVAVLMTAIVSVLAESNVYVFLKSMYNTDTSITINGTEVCKLNGSITKTMNVPGGTMEKRNGCYHKIVLDGEGKILLTGTLLFTVPSNGNVNTYKGEISLDVADGETYYLELTNKGIHDMQIKEVKEKTASKWMQKWQDLGDVKFNI